MAQTFIKTLYKSSSWCKLLLLILIILILFVGVNTYSYKESFINQNEKFSFIKEDKIFDNFYSTIYDDIITDNVKDEYQVGEIINTTNPTQKSLLLDIGSRTGDIVNLFNQKNYNAVGIDKSKSMVDISKKKYPNLNINSGDFENTLIYPAHTFTHITCINDAIYYIKNKKHIINNVYEWLIPGGYFILGLSKNKITKLTNKNKNVFTNFTYKCKIEDHNDNILLIQTFKDNKKIRKQEYTLYFEDVNTILNYARNVGFIIYSQFNLTPVFYNNKINYIFYKPE